MFDLSNKVALVTGSGSWIGREIAIQLAKARANVILVGRDHKKLNQTETMIKELKGNAVSISADISDESNLQSLFKEINSHFQHLDILIQNAAIYPKATIENMSLEEWNQVINVNLTGSFLILKHSLALMKTKQSGRVIFISSIGGEPFGLAGFSHYTASKAGLNGFMRTAALEFAKHNITVNCISPGNILHTEEEAAPNDSTKKMLQSIPLKRFGKPKDIANLALFLASDSANFITGQNYIVDGGETIQAKHFD